MIKHGSKMIQAVSNANVPQITLMCGASFGAGNYGMCGRAYNPRFLFSWPNAQTAVMGAEQAALTMANVMEAGARRKGQEPDAAQIDALKQQDRRQFREPEQRVRHLGAHARRRHHRSARHAQRARLRAVDLPRGGRAHAAAGAVRRGAAMKALLIANRGEIARRIMRTARRMGLRTIAVYSDADRDALHVREADAAVRIGGAAPRESYLNIAAIIDGGASSAGADAVHPGYGFLAENADFAQAVIDAGLTWVGPPPAVDPADGRQGRGEAHRARGRRADHSGRRAGRPEQRRADRRRSAIGFPLMIKAAAGGGGRGMRLVARRKRARRRARCARARRPQHAFGDGRLLLERALDERAPHRGAGVRRPARQCPASRRARLLGAAAAPEADRGSRPRRRSMRRCARSSAPPRSRSRKAVNYVGAGTVEFLLDADGQFYFMEMNTRLQVEHPVTEAITGIDLVEWQLRVAARRALHAARSRDIRFRGHAIEARLCAEDPARDFLPQAGRIALWQPGRGRAHRPRAGRRAPRSRRSTTR